jgi:hypothetical protein
MLRTMKVVEEEEVHNISMMDQLNKKVQDINGVSVYLTTIVRVSLKH